MNDKSTQPTLDFDGARELWMRVFDLTQDEYDRLYEESWNQTPGWWQAYLRVRDAALSLGVGSGPAGFVWGLGGVGWDSGLGGALARLVRPLIGADGGITQEDYETVSQPWSIVIGQVHPDDEVRSGPGRLHALIEEFDGGDDTRTLASFLISRGVTFTD